MWTMGEQQLEVLLDRLRSGPASRWWCSRSGWRSGKRCGPAASGLGRHVKQSGGHGQYAVAQIEIEPLAGGRRLRIRRPGGRRRGAPAIHLRAWRRASGHQLERGVNGHPMVDLRVTLVGGKAHSVDSSDAAFQMAGSLALREASHAAGCRLLEPMDTVTITVDDEFVGAVLADLASRRGRVRGTEADRGQDARPCWPRFPRWSSPDTPSTSARWRTAPAHSAGNTCGTRRRRIMCWSG